MSANTSRWLTMREPRKRDTRQVLKSEWRALVDQGFASGLWEGTDADLYRAEREAGAKRTDAAFAGYLARGLAEMQFFSGIDVPLESAVPTLVQRAQRIMERKGTTLEERAGERAEGWRRQRASMAARAQEDETNPQGNENETPRTCCPTCAGGRP